MRFDIVTLFPSMVTAAVGFGVTGRAIERGLISLRVWNPRDFTHDKHKTVDDRPYGGGPGMVMKYQPLHEAVLAASDDSKASQKKIIFLSPQGRPITQQILVESTSLEQIILVAGRYEGVDERFIQLDCDEEWSIGDYVISGGELAALVVIDGVARLLPGVLGDGQSAEQDSHRDGWLDCPHFTRPESLGSLSVPSVLLSGTHADILGWRMKQAIGRTWQKRPDLFEKKQLTAGQLQLLKEFIVDLEINKGVL